MKKIGWITGKKKLLRLAGLSLMGVLLLSGCGNTGKSAVAAASSTSASETSNEAGKGSKVSQPAENVDAQVAEASLPQPGEAISASLTWKSRMELAYGEPSLRSIPMRMRTGCSTKQFRLRMEAVFF